MEDSRPKRRLSLADSDRPPKECKVDTKSIAMGTDEEQQVSRIYGSKPIKVLVGPDRTPFYVHQELLESKSDFFKGALRHGFVEDRTATVSLPEDDSHIFSKVCEWIYQGKITEFSTDDLVHIFIFADSKLMPNLRNYSVDLYLKYAGRGTKNLGIHLMRYLDEHTPNPKFKEAMATKAAQTARDIESWKSLNTESIDKFFSKDGLVLLVIELFKERGEVRKSAFSELWSKRCRFHDHEKEELHSDEESSTKESDGSQE